MAIGTITDGIAELGWFDMLVNLVGLSIEFLEKRGDYICFFSNTRMYIVNTS